MEEQAKREKQRFDIELWSNENIVSGYNFAIRSFNEGSMSSLDFVQTCRQCVALIKAEMESKSRIATWVYDGPSYENLELLKNKQEYIDAHRDECLPIPTVDGEYLATNYIAKDRYYTAASDYDTKIEPGVQTFKFVVKDRGNVVFEEAWDASVYPKVVRERVDLINDPSKYGDDKDYVGFNSSLMMRMVEGRENLNKKISKIIASVCSPENVSFDKENQEFVFSGKYAFNEDYTFTDEYRNVTADGKHGKTAVYQLGRRQRLNALGSFYSKWEPIAKKTKQYRQELVDLGLLKDNGRWQKRNKRI